MISRNNSQPKKTDDKKSVNKNLTSAIVIKVKGDNKTNRNDKVKTELKRETKTKSS
jgi:hypothetical protein